MRGALFFVMGVAAACGGGHRGTPDLATMYDLASSDQAMKDLTVCPRTVAEYCAANACPADLKTAEACGDSSQVTVGTCPGYIDVITNRYGYADGGAINFLFDPSSGALVGVMSPRGCSDCGNPILSCLAGPGQLWFWPSSCTDTVGCIQQ